MDRNEARRIIADEGLTGCRFFEDRPYAADEVVIDEADGTWRVYVTSERRAMLDGTLDTYATESEALEDFIDRLRADKELRELS